MGKIITQGELNEKLDASIDLKKGDGYCPTKKEILENWDDRDQVLLYLYRYSVINDGDTITLGVTKDTGNVIKTALTPDVPLEIVYYVKQISSLTGDEIWTSKTINATPSTPAVGTELRWDSFGVKVGEDLYAKLSSVKETGDRSNYKYKPSSLEVSFTRPDLRLTCNLNITGIGTSKITVKPNRAPYSELTVTVRYKSVSNTTQTENITIPSGSTESVIRNATGGAITEFLSSSVVPTSDSNLKYQTVLEIKEIVSITIRNSSNGSATGCLLSTSVPPSIPKLSFVIASGGTSTLDKDGDGSDLIEGQNYWVHIINSDVSMITPVSLGAIVNGRMYTI